jgi:hypothetical protein
MWTHVPSSCVLLLGFSRRRAMSARSSGEAAIAQAVACHREVVLSERAADSMRPFSTS